MNSISESIKGVVFVESDLNVSLAQVGVSQVQEHSGVMHVVVLRRILRCYVVAHSQQVFVSYFIAVVGRRCCGHGGERETTLQLSFICASPLSLRCSIR